MRHKIKHHFHTVVLAGLISLLPVATYAAGSLQNDYTFKGKLVQLRYCTFNGSGDETVDFGEVGFRDVGGVKTLDSQTEKALGGTAMTCSGTGPIYLKFDVQTTNLGQAKGGRIKVFTGVGKGIGIELLSGGNPIDFDQKIAVTDPSHVPELKVKVVQNGDGSDMVTGEFNAIATLTIIYA